MNISEKYYYHGTYNDNSKMIKSKGFKDSEKTGTLGSGAYAFYAIKSNAIKFIEKERKRCGKNKRISIVKFKINKDYESNILNFTDPYILDIYENFIQDKISLIYDFINQKKDNKGYVKELDGMIVNAFINTMEKAGFFDEEIFAVYSVSVNKLNKFVVPDTIIGNSIELCIRNNKIVNFETLDIEMI